LVSLRKPSAFFRLENFSSDPGVWGHNFRVLEFVHPSII
jgi:hypothetical protein